jgi:hypothetical protein
LATQAPAPPLIVTSFLADASLWAEVLNCGGFDVVRVPFEADELGRVAALAAEGSQPAGAVCSRMEALACVD